MPDLYFHVPAAPVLLPLWGASMAAAVGWLARRRLLTRGRAVTVLLGATYVVGVLALTLLPMQVRTGEYANLVAWYQKLNLIPILTIDLRTFVLNVVMTIPLGVLTPLILRVRTARRAALVGFVVSLFIEVVQGFTDVFLSSGRTADVNDLVANTTGALVGWYAVLQLRKSARVERFLGRLSVSGRPTSGSPDRSLLPSQ